jgi:pimeloyl-ACP methyl ester carboxylesterase
VAPWAATIAAMARPGVRRAQPALVTLLVAVLLGCGGADQRDAGVPRPPAPTSTPVRPLTAPAERCDEPGPRARVVTFRAADGVALDGVEVGTGPNAAVLLHMVSSDLCDWWPFAGELTRRGVHALMIDLRCSGRSSCSRDARRITDPTADVAGAVALLRRRGARRITVAGASLGGASALIAGAELGSQVQAVASLSGVPEVTSQLTVRAVIARLSAPLLMAVAQEDPAVSVGQTRAMLRQAGSRSKALLVRPASEGHGVALLLGRGDRRSDVLDALVRLIRTGRRPSG